MKPTSASISNPHYDRKTCFIYEQYVHSPLSRYSALVFCINTPQPTTAPLTHTLGKEISICAGILQFYGHWDTHFRIMYSFHLIIRAQFSWSNTLSTDFHRIWTSQSSNMLKSKMVNQILFHCLCLRHQHSPLQSLFNNNFVFQRAQRYVVYL